MVYMQVNGKTSSLHFSPSLLLSHLPSPPFPLFTVWR